MSSANTSPDTYSNEQPFATNATTGAQSTHKRRRSPPLQEDRISPNAGDNTGGGASSAKRIACVICRKRKLKCDGNKPSCSTCKRLNHDCAYDEVRRKSGPKRGYVKALEERLSMLPRSVAGCSTAVLISHDSRASRGDAQDPRATGQGPRYLSDELLHQQYA